MHSFCSFQNGHVSTLLLHNAAVPVGVQQMETLTGLSFTPHDAPTPTGEFLCYVWYKENGRNTFFDNNIYINTLTYVNVASRSMIWRFWFHIPAHNFQL